MPKLAAWGASNRQRRQRQLRSWADARWTCLSTEALWLEPASGQQEMKSEQLEICFNIKKLNINIRRKNSEMNPHTPQVCLITYQVIGQLV